MIETLRAAIRTLPVTAHRDAWHRAWLWARVAEAHQQLEETTTSAQLYGSARLVDDTRDALIATYH